MEVRAEYVNNKDLSDTAAEHQNVVMDDVNNTVEISLYEALESGTLVAVATTVLQGALYSDKLLSAISTELKENNATMLPTTNFIEKETLTVLLSLATRDRNQLF